MEKSRKIYNEMILGKSDIGKLTSSIWLEFFDLEKQYGDEKHQRKLLNRALNELNENENEIEILFDELLKFEKLNGNAQQLSNIYSKYEQFKQKKEAAKAVAQLARNKSNEQEKRSKQPVKLVEKGKLVKTGEQKQPQQKQISLKRKSEEKVPEKRDQDGFLIPSLPVSANLESEDPSRSAKKPKKADTSPVVLSTSSSHGFGEKTFSSNTLFISNLKYDVDENKLRALFEKVVYI